MSSPGSSRRLTRSSVRRCLAGDADEPADCGLKQTSAGISAHQRDGLSSDPGSESEADTVPVHELDSTVANQPSGMLGSVRLFFGFKSSRTS